MQAFFIVVPRAIFMMGVLLVPAPALGMSGDQVRRLNREFEDDLKSLDAFGGVRRADRWSHALERPRVWTLYGRLGVLSFQNDLEPRDKDGFRFSLRRSGPKLTGKVYVGIHREF
jgi:hypothetical protein